MRKADTVIFGVMAVGFGAIAWTAWSERVTPVPVPQGVPISGGVSPAKAPGTTVQGRQLHGRPMYEYKVVRVPRLIFMEDDEERHDVMMRVAYKLCFGFSPYYGYEDRRGVMLYNHAQDVLNERDAEELGPEGLQLYQKTYKALCDWDVQMWEVYMFKYGMTASGPDRPAAGAMAVSVDALSRVLERLTDERLATGLKQPRVIPFTEVKVRIAGLKPTPPPSPAEPALTSKELRAYAKMKDELVALTEALGRAAASWPPDEQARLTQLLLGKLAAFDAW
jgi:hypothetical protein